MGGIDEAAIDQLALVTEMTKKIRMKAEEGELLFGLNSFLPSHETNFVDRSYFYEVKKTVYAVDQTLLQVQRAREILEISHPLSYGCCEISTLTLLKTATK